METKQIDARKKARYGHRNWIVWHDGKAVRHCARLTAESVKAAMLTCGTQGHFTMYEASTGTPWRVGWRHAANLLANARAGYL